MLIRQATEADIPTLVAMRMALFCEVGELPYPTADSALIQATESYFTNAFLSGSALSWLAEVDKQVVAAGTLAMFVRPPYPGNLAGVEGYLLNMYTQQQWRRQGIATALLDTIAAFAIARQLGKVWLHASEQGRPIYERIGFVANPAQLEWLPAVE